jgi:mannose-6-phosphate isomerase-like protein (cupin superfamily)
MEIRTIFDACHFSAEKMQKVSLFATSELFLDVYYLEPGQDQKVHKHEASSKIYIVLEGHGRFHVGKGIKDVGAGQAVLARTGEMHGVSNATTERLVLLVSIAPPPQHA